MNAPMRQAGEASASERELKLAVVILAALYLASGVFWSRLSPGGAWVNQVFTVLIWNENDPGGWYIPAGHDLLLHPGRSCFGGHPGTPLVLLLAAEQALLYGWGVLSGTTLDLTAFVARHVAQVWILAKISMAAVHLVSLVLLYRFARHLLPRGLAFLSVGLYASSFPAAYFQTRVSGESLVNVFFLGTLLAVHAATRHTTGIRPLASAALAGFLAVSALYAKLHTMAAWPLYAACWLVVGQPTFDRSAIRRTVLLLGAYGLGAGLAVAAYEPLTDWPALAHTWEGDGGGRPASEVVSRLAVGVLTGSANALRQMSLLHLAPALTQSNAVFFFEFLYACAALVGGVLFFRRPSPQRRFCLFALGYAALSLFAWFYRSFGQDFHGFHYLFTTMLTTAPLAALGCAALVTGVTDPAEPRDRRALSMAVVVLVVHHGALFGVFDSRCQDALSYQSTGSALAQAELASLGPGQRIGVVGGRASALHGMSDSYARPDRPSALLAELRRILVDVPRTGDPGGDTQDEDDRFSVLVDVSRTPVRIRGGGR